MNAKNYEPQYTAAIMAVTKKKEEIEQRKQYLINKNASSATTLKKEYRNSTIENKLDQIDQEEEQTIKYFRDEIAKAEDRYESEISRAEEKLRVYKAHCLDSINKTKDKNEIKRNALELKKGNTATEFDDSSDQQIIKLNVELKELEGKAERAENHMSLQVSRDRENQRA